MTSAVDMKRTKIERYAERHGFFVAIWRDDYYGYTGLVGILDEKDNCLCEFVFEDGNDPDKHLRDNYAEIKKHIDKLCRQKIKNRIKYYAKYY
jgi:hypothetical protein